MKTKQIALDTNILIAHFLSSYEIFSKPLNAEKYKENINKNCLVPSIVMGELYYFILKKTYKKIVKSLSLSPMSVNEAMKKKEIIVKVNTVIGLIVNSLENDGFIFEISTIKATEAIENYLISFTDFIIADKYELITGDENLNSYIESQNK